MLVILGRVQSECGQLTACLEKLSCGSYPDFNKVYYNYYYYCY